MNQKKINYRLIEDSKLSVLQENYSYIWWSVLAIGILAITIRTVKR